MSQVLSPRTVILFNDFKIGNNSKRQAFTIPIGAFQEDIKFVISHERIVECFVQGNIFKRNSTRADIHKKTIQLFCFTLDNYDGIIF